MRALVILAVACCFAMPVLAQTRAEQQIRDINRSIESQQRNLREQQSNQFEANQLRQDLSRQRNARHRHMIAAVLRKPSWKVHLGHMHAARVEVADVEHD